MIKANKDQERILKELQEFYTKNEDNYGKVVEI